MTERTDRKPVPQPAPGTPRIGRRGFFGASLGLAATGLAGGAALPVLAAETGDERTKARYQPDSPHIKEYYHVNRLVWPQEK